MSEQATATKQAPEATLGDTAQAAIDQWNKDHPDLPRWPSIKEQESYWEQREDLLRLLRDIAAWNGFKHFPVQLYNRVKHAITDER